ncbi:MAG TPA: efflux RND transporter periplasmic adaptor subunit, partial [Fimbriimonas sp.]|nr:efflux RND transporter periplasmic adaptor subunit [Fimbriimonas sp.]
ISDREREDAETAHEVQKKAVRIAETSLLSAKQILSTAVTQLANAKTQVEFARKRAASNTQVAEARVNDAKSGLKVAQANRAQNPAYKENLRALEAGIQVAQAGVAQAQADLSDTLVRSKLSGVITLRSADPGALAGPGTPVLVVESLDWLYFSASVPVETSGKLRVGQQASIFVESLGKPVQGQISHINPSANVLSRQVQVKIRIENPGKELRPGMIGKMELQLDAKKVAVSVPKEALQYKGKIVQVGVVTAESKIEVRDVEIGFSDDKVVEIKSGLKAGEKVITLISEPLRDGKEVKVAGAKSESR